jgi:quercetin dioxygenase-like cupin family protein
MKGGADEAKVLHPEKLPEIERGAGIRSRPLIGKWNTETSELTTGITRFAPRTSIAPHSHNREETIMILEGEAAVVVGDQRTDLVAGDVTWVPADVPHYFLNRGTGPMRIYWVYAGRHITRTLVATGETFDHLSDEDLRVGRKD